MVKKGGFKKGGLHEVNFGLAGGIISGACIFLMTLAYLLFGVFPESLSLVQDFYGILGYDVTWFGLFLGTIYGFIDGFILLWVFALIYNRLR